MYCGNYDPSLYCHKCGEKPFFGNLVHGLCSECLEKERREKKLEEIRRKKNREDAEKRIREILEQNDKFHREMMEQSERQHQQLLDVLLPWQECCHCHRQERKDRLVTEASKTYCCECGRKLEKCSVCEQVYVKEEPIYVYSCENEGAVNQEKALIVCEEKSICPTCFANDQKENPAFWENQALLKKSYEAQLACEKLVELEKKEIVGRENEKQTVDEKKNEEAGVQRVHVRGVSAIILIVGFMLPVITLLVEYFYFGCSRLDMAKSIGAFAGVYLFVGLFNSNIFMLSVTLLLSSVMALFASLAIYFALLAFGLVSWCIKALIELFFDCMGSLDFITEGFNILITEGACVIYYCLCLLLGCLLGIFSQKSDR